MAWCKIEGVGVTEVDPEATRVDLGASRVDPEAIGVDPEVTAATRRVMFWAGIERPDTS